MFCVSDLTLSLCVWHHFLFCLSPECLFVCIPRTTYLHLNPFESHFRSVCRVGVASGEASHLVSEADRRLQERGRHRPGVFVAKRRGPVRPHPQVQTSADVRNKRWIAAAYVINIQTHTEHWVFCCVHSEWNFSSTWTLNSNQLCWKDKTSAFVFVSDSASDLSSEWNNSLIHCVTVDRKWNIQETLIEFTV